MVLLFFIKAMWLAFFVTPLWDITDETGHYAYALDLAEGRGIPLLGEAVVDSNLVAHVTREPGAPAVVNGIAQHPPVYYFFAAIPIKIGQWAGAEQELLYRLPRIVAAISGAGVVWVLYQIAMLLGLGTVRSLAVATMAGCIPGVTHLASGTSHDVTLFLFCALAIHGWARFILTRRFSAAVACAFWLALAGGTKLTALVLLAPLLATLVVELEGPWRIRVKQSVLLGMLAGSLPSLWLLRNWIYFRHPFYSSLDQYRWLLDVPLNQSMQDYIRQTPALDHFATNFIGVFGWLGTGCGRFYVWMIRDTPLIVFSCLLLLMGLLLVGYMVLVMRRSALRKGTNEWNRLVPLSMIFSSLSAKYRFIRVLSWLFGIGLSLWAFVFVLQSPSHPESVWLRLVAIALMWTAGALAVPVLLRNNTASERLVAYACLIFTFFTLIVLREVYGMYLLDGRMRATWGRYLYPVAPLLFAGVCVAVRDFKIRAGILLLLAVLLAYFEMDTFLGQVIPFYTNAL